MRVDDVEVVVEGTGPRTIVMIHGWPDTHRLWDTQVDALRSHYRCVRFTLPGFDLARPGRAYSLDELVATIRHVVEQACAGERVTLLLHDWGCFFGYQFATRHPQLVRRVIAVDIGDAGSRHHLAELDLKAKLKVVAYQWWLALAWRIGRAIGDRMARSMARALRCPTPAAEIGAQMGYLYAVQWFGVRGGFGRAHAYDPPVPMLFVYGQRKPFMFHSRAWLDRLAARPGQQVVGLPTGHWVMIQRPGEFNETLLAWLAQTDGVAA